MIKLILDFLLKHKEIGQKFTLLSKGQLKQCMNMMSINIYLRGDTLYKQGDIKKFNYLVLNGVVNSYEDADLLKRKKTLKKQVTVAFDEEFLDFD